MPTMKNPRSVALANANPRLLSSPNADVLLSASTPIFHVNNSGISTPSIITLNASLIAMEGAVTFTCEGGTLSSVTGNTCALLYDTLASDNAKVTATITYRNKTYTDTVEISKVYDGANGVTGLNNALMYAYQRSATQPTGTPGTVEWSFPAAGITTAALANGWQKTIPSGSLPLWITAASASASGSLDTVQANEWSTPVILALNGLDGVSPALMNLSCSAQTFTYNSSGVAIPANQTITFTAEPINTTGTATFTCAKYDSAGASLGTVVLGGTGNVRTLTDTQFTVGAFRAVVTATLGTLTDTVTVVRLADGAAGTGVSALAGYLTNESVTVPTASDGSAPVLTNAKGSFKVFQGTTDVTSSCTFSIVGSTLVNTVAPTSGTGAYAVTGAGTWANSSMTTSVTYRATHTPSGATIDQVLIITKAPAGLQGNAGVNSATITIYQRTATTTAPALPSASVTYTFTPAGLTGLTNGWTTTIPAASVGGYLWASTATAVAAATTDTIAATEWAAAQMIGQPGTKGDRGNVQVARAIPGSVWSDSEAALAISGNGYGVPQNRDIVTLYNNSAAYSQQKYYDGTAWQALAAYFPGGVIVDGTVDAIKINSRGLDIKDLAGNVILRAGSSLAQQTMLNPNLVPRISSWPVAARVNASPGISPNDARFYNSEYMILNNVDGYAGMATLPLGIPQNSYVTVSFDVYCLGASRTLVVDFEGGGVDTTGITIGTTQTRTHYKFTEQITHANAAQARLRVYSMFAASEIIVGNIKVEMGVVETAWCDNVITKQNASTYIAAAAIDLALIDKASITNLSAVSTSLGDVLVEAGGTLHSGQSAYGSGNGFFIEGAGNGHGARMSVGDSSTNKQFLCDPTNGVFEMNGVKLNNPVYDAFTATISGSLSTTVGNGAQGYGSLTVTAGGAYKAPISIRWGVERESVNGTAVDYYVSGDPTGSTVALRGTATNERIIATVFAQITDANGRIVQASRGHTVTHGTFTQQ